MHSFSMVYWLASTSLSLAAPSVTFSVSAGIPSKRNAENTTIQTKLNDLLYSIDVDVPSEYILPPGDANIYQVEAKKQLNTLKQEFQAVGVVSSSSDAEWVDILLNALSIHSDDSQFVAELSTLEPLLPHHIFQIMATPDSEKKLEDTVDTRSVALLAALSTSCDLVKYPLNNPSGSNYEYGVWCDGLSYRKGIPIHKGVLLAQHPDLLSPNLKADQVRRWTDEEAIKLVYGHASQSETLIPTGKTPSINNTDTTEDPKASVPQKLSDDSPSSTDGLRDTSMDVYLILGGFTLIALLAYGVQNSNRKKHIAKLKEELHNEEEF